MTYRREPVGKSALYSSRTILVPSMELGVTEGLVVVGASQYLNQFKVNANADTPSRSQWKVNEIPVDCFRVTSFSDIEACCTV